MAIAFISFSMKNFPRRILALLVIFSLFLTQGCSLFDEKTQVRNYNNTIVDLQQKMLKKNQDAATVLTMEDNLEPQKALQEMQKVLADVQQSYQDFQVLKVPKGGEDLATAMKNFFEVEIAGVKNLVDTLQTLSKSSKKEVAYQNLLKTADDFSKKENDALKHFDEVQKQTALHYGEKVEDTLTDPTPSPTPAK